MDYISYENVSGGELVASPYTMPLGTEIVSTTGVIPELEAKIGLGINKFINGVLQTYFVVANPITGNLASNGVEVSGVVTISYAKSGAQTVVVGTARIYPPRALTLSKWECWTGSAPTGASLIAIIKKNGVTVETLTLSADSNYATGTATSAMLATDYLTVDITQIGSTTAGSDLSIRLTGN